MDAMDSLKLTVYRFKHSLDSTLIQLTLMRSRVSKYKPEVLNDLDEMIEEYYDVLKKVFDLVNSRFVSNFTPFIKLINPLVMTPSESGIYKFVSGYSPWKFLLKLEDEDELENITSIILYELGSNVLSQCTHPENGTVVLAMDNGSLYRAFVLETISKISYRIMNIDTGEISIVAIESLNDLPISLSVFPPQALYCTLLKDQFLEKYWNDNFSENFTTIMKSMKFSIKIIEQISINPPCYEVHLKGTRNGNESYDSDWFLKTFLENIELCRDDIELFYKYGHDPVASSEIMLPEHDRGEQPIVQQSVDDEEVDDGNNDVANLNDDFDSNIEFIKTVFERFCERYKNEEKTSRFSSIHSSDTEEEIDVSDYDDEINVDFSKVDSDEKLEEEEVKTFRFHQPSTNTKKDDRLDLGDDGEYEDNTANLDADIERLRDEVKRFLLKEPLSHINPAKEDEVSHLNEEYLENNVAEEYLKSKIDEEYLENNADEEYLDNDIAEEYLVSKIDEEYLENNVAEKYIENEIDEESETGMKICKVHIREPTFQRSPEIQQGEENMPDLCDEYESNIGLLEADIGEECKDEVKTCKFQLKEGRCWKEYCPREHINPGPGFIGSVYTYGYFDFEYPLPDEKVTIQVKPKMIVSGHIFFGHLIDFITWNQPDLKLLEIRMNSMEEVLRFERFDLLPTIGELCLVYGKLKRWYRARIIEIAEMDVQVLSVDYGYGEKVSLKNIRKMKYEYLFLPPQAIRCVLHGIVADEERKSEAMAYMRDVALNQTFKAVVIESHQLDSSIEISLVCPYGRNIVLNLIAKGYYRQVQSSLQSTVSEGQ